MVRRKRQGVADRAYEQRQKHHEHHRGRAYRYQRRRVDGFGVLVFAVGIAEKAGFHPVVQYDKRDGRK